MRTAFQTPTPTGTIHHRRLPPLRPLPPHPLTTAVTTITTRRTANSSMAVAAASAAAGTSVTRPPPKDALPLPLIARTTERILASLLDTGNSSSVMSLLFPLLLLLLPPPPSPPPPPPRLPLWQPHQTVLSSRTVTVLLSRVWSISQHPARSTRLSPPRQSPSPNPLSHTLWTRITGCSPPPRLLLPTPCHLPNFLLRKLRRISVQW